MTSNLHPIFEQALKPWAPPPKATKTPWPFPAKGHTATANGLDNALAKDRAKDQTAQAGRDNAQPAPY
jgi:hypothetical protein